MKPGEAVAVRWVAFVVAIIIVGVLGYVPSGDAVVVGAAIVLLGDAWLVRP